MPSSNVKCEDNAAEAAALSSSSPVKNKEHHQMNHHLRQRHVNKGTTTTTTTTTTITTTTTTIKVSRLDDTANNNINNANNNNSTGIANKQRSITLRQLHAHRQEEQERKHVMNEAFSNVMQMYFKSLLVLCLVGLALLCFLAPTVVSKWTRASYSWLQNTFINPQSNLPPPPARTLITIYPMHIHVRRDLPTFFQAYAVATPHNTLARRAVQHAAMLRHCISQQSSDNNIYKQRMALVPWDVVDFTSQLRTIDSMDRFCGVLGYGQAFYGLSSTITTTTTADHHQQAQQQHDSILFHQNEVDEKRQDLMLWCLLASGHHDGYIKFQVQGIDASLSRGISGIAITKRQQRQQKDDENKSHEENHHDNDKDDYHASIDSSCILFLPQHDSYKLSLGQPLGPSTLVPRKTLAWIVEHVHLPLHSYRRGLEQFLHQVIFDEISSYAVEQQAAEAAAAAAAANSSSNNSHANQPLAPLPKPPLPKWILWTAACTEKERLVFQQQYRLMATTCITTTNTTSSSNNNNSTSTTTAMAQNNSTSTSSSKKDCCSFYDPKLPPLIRRRRHDDD